MYPQSGRQWEDSLAFSSLTGSLHTYVCVYIFTYISSKWGVGDLKGPELNTCFCLRDRAKNGWAVRAWDQPLPAAEEHKKLTAPAGISLPVIIKYGIFICYKNLHFKVDENVSHKPQGPADIGRTARFGLRFEYESMRKEGEFLRRNIWPTRYVSKRHCHVSSPYLKSWNTGILWGCSGQWGGGREEVVKAKKTDASKYLAR